MPSARTVSVYRSLSRFSKDEPGLRYDGSLEDSEHRRRIAQVAEVISALVLGSLPVSAQCTADTSVSTSTFVAVTGLSSTHRAALGGALGVTGSLYVEEVSAGSLSVQILNGSTVVWTSTVREQGAVLLTGSPYEQLGQWIVPIGAPDLVTAATDTAYTLSVEIAAPTGEYKVLTGTGKESWMQTQLVPTVTV